MLIENEAAVTSTLMRPGQTLLLLTRVQAATQPSTPAQGSSLTIAYEDEHFAAVVKPQGMLTVRMGTSRPGLVLSSCIKHTLTMPRIPGAVHVLIIACPRLKQCFHFCELLCSSITHY